MILKIIGWIFAIIILVCSIADSIDHAAARERRRKKSK
jgi:hypothetical protein